MKILYIAGKYRGRNIREVQQNIEKASDVAFKYWEKGFAVICPHKNTSFFDSDIPDKVFLDGDLEILKKCDGIVMMKDWDKSVGAINELKLAKELKLDIIYE